MAIFGFIDRYDAAQMMRHYSQITEACREFEVGLREGSPEKVRDLANYTLGKINWYREITPQIVQRELDHEPRVKRVERRCKFILSSEPKTTA